MLIREVIVTTSDAEGVPHIAPMGIWWNNRQLVIAPFRPSRTLDNLLASRCAAINYCDDVRIFAGCLTGRHDWPLTACEEIGTQRLANIPAHAEVKLATIQEDPLRPQLICDLVHEANHHPFQGFNRAQAAVLELAILVSRMERLPADKIRRELQYLQIAVDKTAGKREQQAWDWLTARLDAHLQNTGGETS